MQYLCNKKNVSHILTYKNKYRSICLFIVDLIKSSRWNSSTERHLHKVKHVQSEHKVRSEHAYRPIGG